MIIKKVEVLDNYLLNIIGDNLSGIFDVKPYLNGEVFKPLKDKDNFHKIYNGGYFLEWECGADISADTIEYDINNNDNTN